MIVWLLAVLLLGLLAVNVALWKFGFIHLAEHPQPVLDVPVLDARERKAVLKRLERWREEGKLTRAEYETVRALCDQEWDGKTSGE